MRILCTCPGRHGDILLALPTLRAIAERLGVPVDLAVAPPYAGVCALATRQDYIKRAFTIPRWAIVEAAPITPREPPVLPPGYDAVFHLGYEGWPLQPLLFEHFGLLLTQWPAHLGPAPVLDHRPWLSNRPPPRPRALDALRRRVSLGWSEEWVELKVGVSVLLAWRFPQVEFQWLRPWAASRYDEVGVLPANVAMLPATFVEAARAIGRSQVFVGCNSALSHVATGLGVPVVLMEPAEARWHPSFYSYGTEGPRVRLVRGNDGRPTFDARHVGDALAQALQEAR